MFELIDNQYTSSVHSCTKKKYVLLGVVCEGNVRAIERERESDRERESEREREREKERLIDLKYSKINILGKAWSYNLSLLKLQYTRPCRV